MMPVRSGYPYCNDLVPGTSRRELETPWKLLWFLRRDYASGRQMSGRVPHCHEAPSFPSVFAMPW